METWELSEEEWRQRLTPEQYHVLREKGTEPAFTGKYWNCKESGVYHCAACNAPLFSSEDKFESGTGWPSFTTPMNAHLIAYEEDVSLLYERTEVLCARCHGHLGHVFGDGPPPSHKRYCLNSAALEFKNR